MTCPRCTAGYLDDGTWPLGPLYCDCQAGVARRRADEADRDRWEEWTADCAD